GVLKCLEYICSSITHKYTLPHPSHLSKECGTEKGFDEIISHTVQDLVFIWNMTDPLVVNPEIELPQLDISNNYTTDCTINYSTGNFTCLAIVFNLKRRLGYHLFHTYIPSALIVFAVVNNYMGPIATKAMKGYSDENLHESADLNY
uniref:Uncharacterized protein n=1 Tax=Megaselia scalaris TaxID=36166 RepID=T1GU40_MEGSC